MQGWVKIANYPYNNELAYWKKLATGECYLTNTYDYWLRVDCPNAGISPSGNAVPSITGTGASTGGVLIQTGGSWYEDLLNTLLGLGAISQGATHIPSTNQGVSQNPFAAQLATIQAQNNLAQANTRRQDETGIGSGLERFVKENATLLLIGVGVFALYKSGRK